MLGPLMMDVAGPVLTEEERDILQHPLVGGVILFSRNYQSLSQLTSLIVSIRTLRDPHLLIAVDHEGGRVQRFREGWTTLPSVATFGSQYELYPQKTLQDVEVAGWLMAAELRAVGVDFSFAPVLDLDYGVSEVIGDRSFHRDPQIVTDLSRAYINGMARASMAAIGKHFPGHGAVEVDSHLALPIDVRDFNDIWQADMLPFRRLCHQQLDGIMPAHIVYQQSDRLPAGFSSFWLKEVLRHKIGFQGAILSDDLNMEGAAMMGDSIDRATAALEAGCDMALFCNCPKQLVKVIDGLKYKQNPVSHGRLIRLQGGHARPPDELFISEMWQNAVKTVASYTPDYQVGV